MCCCFSVIAFSTGMTKAIVAPEPVLETEIIPAPQQKMELPPEPPQLTRAPTPDVPVPLVNIETPPAPGAIKVAAATPAPTAPSLPLQGTAETRQSYYARLLAQLNRVKRYPAAARTAHVEGVVMLHFVMNADGRVLSFEIATSSGKPLLDAEALALIARAQPLPPDPARLEQAPARHHGPDRVLAALIALSSPVLTGEVLERSDRGGGKSGRALTSPLVCALPLQTASLATSPQAGEEGSRLTLISLHKRSGRTP